MDLPLKFAERMKNILGEEYQAFIAEYSNPPQKALRLNGFKPTTADLSSFNLSQMPYGENCFYYEDSRPGLSPLHHAGAFYIQEPSAIFPVDSLPLKKGDKVLDLCAAPGGKTTQIADRIGAEGFLLSNEIDTPRSKILLSNVERLGLTNTIVTNLPTKLISDYYENCFDAVLVDAPCSGEGMFRKEPVALQDWSEKSVLGCAIRSFEALERGANCVKGGGYLLYSTCTFSLEENENNVKAFLQAHPNFSLVPLNPRVYPYTREGIDLPLCRRMYPHTAKGEGQFAALFKKDGDEKGSPSKKIGKTSPLSPQEKKVVEKFLKDTITHWEDFQLCKTLGGIFLTPNSAFPVSGALVPGIKVGELTNGRLVTHHHFFSALGNRFFNKLNLSNDSVTAKAYIHGDEIQADTPNGWGAILIDGCPLGGFKATDGNLKNRYPKGLRK